MVFSVSIGVYRWFILRYFTTDNSDDTDENQPHAECGKERFLNSTTIRAVNHGWPVEIQSGVAIRPFLPRRLPPHSKISRVTILEFRCLPTNPHFQVHGFKERNLVFGKSLLDSSK